MLRKVLRGLKRSLKAHKMKKAKSREQEGFEFGASHLLGRRSLEDLMSNIECSRHFGDDDEDFNIGCERAIDNYLALTKKEVV